MKYTFWMIFDRTRRWLPWIGGIAAGSLLAFWIWVSFMQPHVSGVSEWLAEEPEVVIDTTTVHTNALANESSPYLQRHVHDLIDWRPWNDDAFKLAAEQDKPLFVVVGYSSCYVCRVMASESFSDVQIAAVLNSKFIPVMVDRESRPDIDERMLLATQLIRQQSGWPNLVWLTPSREPWMASSYLNRDELLKTLNDLAEIWETQRDRAVTQATDVTALMDNVLASAVTNQPKMLDSNVINAAVDKLTSRFDPLRGGFRGSPKFPPHGALRVLMHQYKTAGKSVYENPIRVTLDGMWLGALHDHIGGGFHRYTADAQWRLPRYEKLLIDNALHMRNYTEAYATFRTPRYRDAVTEIYDWTMRDLTSPEGAFYTAVDSGELGERGNWYLWNVDALNETLGVEDSKIFQRIYNIDPTGNLPGGQSRGQVGLNHPYLSHSVRQIAKARNRDPELFAAEIAGMRDRLRASRDQADHPEVDRKILADANGLMIGSLAYAGMTLDRPHYVDVAARAAEFVTSNMISNDVLYHSYYGGEASHPAFLRDYALLIDGLLTLYEATNDPRWLTQAQLLADWMIERFSDRANGGFFFTDGSNQDWPQRSKGLAILDNSPDSNGMAAIALLRLGTLTGEQSYIQHADRTILSLLHYHTSKHVTNGEHLLLAAAMRLTEYGSRDATDAHQQR